MRPRWRPADVWWRRSAAPRPIISPPHVRRLRERRKHHLYVPAERSGAGTSQPNGSSTDLWDRDDPSDGGGQRPRPGRRMPAWALLKWIGTKTLATPTDDPACVHKPLRPSSPLHPGRGEALGAPLPRSPAPLSLWLLEGGGGIIPHALSGTIRSCCGLELLLLNQHFGNPVSNIAFVEADPMSTIYFQQLSRLDVVNQSLIKAIS